MVICLHIVQLRLCHSSRIGWLEQNVWLAKYKILTVWPFYWNSFLISCLYFIMTLKALRNLSIFNRILVLRPLFIFIILVKNKLQMIWFYVCYNVKIFLLATLLTAESLCVVIAPTVVNCMTVAKHQRKKSWRVIKDSISNCAEIAIDLSWWRFIQSFWFLGTCDPWRNKFKN